MDLPAHQDVSHTTAFKNLQFQFVNWAASWAHRGDQIEDSLVKDVIPSLSDEMKQITYSVVNYLLYMHSSAETNTVLKSATPLPVPTESALETGFDVYREPSCVAKVSSLQNDFMAIPDITVSSPRDTTSSGRSLDTLILREGNANLPAARPLVSEDLTESSGVEHSSEDVAHLSRSHIPRVIEPSNHYINPNDFRKAILLLKSAYRNLFDGISLILEMHCIYEPFDSVFEQSTNAIKSIEKLVSSAAKSPPTTIASGLDLSISTPNKGQSQLNSDIGEGSMTFKSAMGVETAVKSVLTNTELTSTTPLPVPTESALETGFDVYREPSCVAKVSSLQNDFMAISDITVSSPRDTTSSGRYTSLDTLMSREGNADLPAARPLVSEDLSESSGVVHSSENVARISRSDISSDSDGSSSIYILTDHIRKAELLLKSAYRSLFDGVSLIIEMHLLTESFDSVFEPSTKTIESIEKTAKSTLTKAISSQK